MERRLKDYMSYLEKLSAQAAGFSKEEREEQKRRALVQIQFFQHERLIHLIVTVTFAILTMIAVSVCVFEPNAAMVLLVVMLLVLLVPYVRHYYILENGVQKLYGYYDLLEEEENGKTAG